MSATACAQSSLVRWTSKSHAGRSAKASSDKPYSKASWGSRSTEPMHTNSLPYSVKRHCCTSLPASAQCATPTVARNSAAGKNA
eukprot:10467940-Alexandrium_andersonii.AAC.1